MTYQLELLENAISDVGYWRWWTESDNIFQIEFGGVQLYNPTEDSTKPPSGILAIAFDSPICVALIDNKTNKDSETEWFQQLQKDEIEPFDIDHDKFTFTDLRQIKSLPDYVGLTSRDRETIS